MARSAACSAADRDGDVGSGDGREDPARGYWQVNRAEAKTPLPGPFNHAAAVATAHASWAWARRVRSPGREIRWGWVLKVL